MKNLFYELFKEASLHEVMIDNEKWEIGFNTIIYDDNGKIKYSFVNDKNFNTLVVKNEEEFFNCLREYLILEDSVGRKNVNFLDNSDKNRYKMILSYLFANATSEDFLKPVLYVKRVMDYLNDETFKNFNEGVVVQLDEIFDNNYLKIKNVKQDVRMETPYKIGIEILNKDNMEERYELPSVYYGITSINGEKECYIYSILNPKNDGDSKFAKKIKRKLYKVNKEAKKECNFNNVNYDEDDLNLVSPSAVISLTIFLSLLKLHNISNVKGVSMLPVRYLSRDIVLDDISDEEKRKKLFQRNINIQNNATDKFIRTFRRVSYNMDGVDVMGNPYLGDSYITLRLDNKKTVTNNKLLNEIVMVIDKNKIK